MTLAVGQQIEVDITALTFARGLPTGDTAVGTIVALYPGAITVRLALGDPGAEITVSLGRVRR